MASFQFTPAIVPTSEPVSTAIASALATLGASFLRGSSAAKSKKEAEHQADIARQAEQVRSIGQSFLEQLARTDASAPEIQTFASFVNQKIEESPGPADEQAMVRAEGERILKSVQDRAETGKFTGQIQSLGENLNMALQNLASSMAATLEQRDVELRDSFNALTSKVSDAAQRSDQALAVASAAPHPTLNPALLGIAFVVLVLLLKNKVRV